MEVYFGTVHRGARLDQSGHAVRFDWETKEVLGRYQVTPNAAWSRSRNPRGGTRGCRGIAVTDDRVYAMGAHTIHELDRSLNHVRDHDHGLMVGLHETCLSDEPGRLWLASTQINLALEFDLRTGDKARLFLPRQMPAFQKALGLVPLGVDPEADNRGAWRYHDLKADPSHLHLNAVALAGDRVLALFNRFGVIADLTEGRVLVKDPALERGHNLVVLDDGTLVSVDTHGRTVRFYDPADGSLVHVVDLMAFPWMKELRRSVKQGPAAALAKPLFTRGLAVVGAELLVGTSPASILRVDWRTSTIVDTHQYSDDVRVAIHGLTVAPDPGPPLSPPSA
jgi:hypothetical protein